MSKYVRLGCLKCQQSSRMGTEALGAAIGAVCSVAGMGVNGSEGKWCIHFFSFLKIYLCS